MDRGHLGTTPLGAERDADAYLDFVEGARVFVFSKIDPVMRQRSQAALDQFEADTRQKADTIDAIKQVMNPLPIVATRNRLLRSSQEMMWRGVIDAYRDRAEEFRRELDAYDQLGPGTVEWDPAFVYPDYFATVDYHVQPGGYQGDALNGYIYHYGTKVFFTGRNNDDGVHRDLVNRTPLPPEGQARRILDLACGVGQATTAFKERFPDAEVWGIDAGAPMVRYAHKRAVDMGLAVHFRQQLAEALAFPDNHFDIVFAFILFHEVPAAISERIVAEAHRVLRPGGVFVVIDAANQPAAGRPPLREYAYHYEVEHNGEPYFIEFAHSDFNGWLRRTFRSVDDNASPGLWLPMRVAVK